MNRTLLAALVAVPTLAAVGRAQFATQVVASNTNGNAGGGIFNPANALGPALGATHVHSLGIAGHLTLGFAAPITDAPGADFLVAENAFALAGSFWQSFAEVAFVEVSSDGVSFCRFPARYWGPATPPGAFATVPIGTYAGLAGQTPSFPLGAGDPRDVVEAGGDAFDLADLAGDPLVIGGVVNLAAITQVRLVDVVGGQSLDAAGAPIFDPGAGSADIDAITVVHQLGAIGATHPVVELSIQTDGTMVLRLAHTGGWQQLDFPTLRAALFGSPVDAAGLLSVFSVTAIDANGFTLAQPVPLPAGLAFTLSVSLQDQQGQHAGQQRTRPHW